MSSHLSNRPPADLPTDHLRQCVLQYVPLTAATVLSVRALSSSWRSSLECSPAYVRRPAEEDVLVSHNGRSAVVFLRGSDLPHMQALEVRKPKRTVLIKPALATIASSQRNEHDPAKTPRMTERQLYRIFHVLDTVVRARPELQLSVALDYRQWFPRDEDGSSIAGFSDPDTLASITPQQLLTLSLGPTTPLGPSAFGSMVAGCYQLAALTIERWCDDETLAVVARGLPNLLSLTIKQATKLTDAALLFASPLLTNLNSLDLCECPQLTDRGLTAMIRGSAAQLENIRVSFCERMTDLTMTQISASCGRNLLLLDVSGNPLITAQGVILLFPEHCKLQELHVNFVSGAIDADVLEAILENGWTVQKISAAFTHLDVGYGAAPLIQKLRSRGTDVMC